MFKVLFNGLTTTFIKEFLFGLWLTLPLWVSIVAFIIVIGQIVGKKEGWLPFEAFYWSFITATTVGYGDIRPTKRSSKVLSIIIGFAGLLFSGILVAVAVHSASIALRAHEAAIKTVP